MTRRQKARIGLVALTMAVMLWALVLAFMRSPRAEEPGLSRTAIPQSSVDHNR